MKSTEEWVERWTVIDQSQFREFIEDVQRDALDAAADGIEALHGEGKGATYASIGASYIRGLKP